MLSWLPNLCVEHLIGSQHPKSQCLRCGSIPPPDARSVRTNINSFLSIWQLIFNQIRARARHDYFISLLRPRLPISLTWKDFSPFFGCVDKKSNKGFHLYHYTRSNTFSRESERRKSGRWNYHSFCLFCIFRPFSADPSINRSDISEHYNGFTIKRFLPPLESFSSPFVVAWFHSRHRSPEMLSFLNDYDKIIGSFICRRSMVNGPEI